MKTSDLIGSQLDWAVAKVEGKTVHLMGSYLEIRHPPHPRKRKSPPVTFWAPSTDWSQGGPIIEREKIKVAPNLGGSWHGQIRHVESHALVAHPVLTGWTNKHGPTPLIAAMRCYVASKMGDEVLLPEELK